MEPVQIGKTPAKDQPASPVVFIKGTQDGDRGKQWLRKKQLFTEGSSVDVNEDELNAWITAGTAPEPPKAADGKMPDKATNGKKPDKAADGKKPDQVAPAGPTGLIRGSAHPISGFERDVADRCERKSTWTWWFKHSLIMRASGQFVKKADGFAFAPERFYVGCCPLHRLPGVGRFGPRSCACKREDPGDLSAALEETRPCFCRRKLLAS